MDSGIKRVDREQQWRRGTIRGGVGRHREAQKAPEGRRRWTAVQQPGRRARLVLGRGRATGRCSRRSRGASASSGNTACSLGNRNGGKTPLLDGLPTRPGGRGFTHSTKPFSGRKNPQVVVALDIILVVVLVVVLDVVAERQRKWRSWCSKGWFQLLGPSRAAS